MGRKSEMLVGIGMLVPAAGQGLSFLGCWQSEVEGGQEEWSTCPLEVSSGRQKGRFLSSG